MRRAKERRLLKAKLTELYEFAVSRHEERMALVNDLIARGTNRMKQTTDESEVEVFKRGLDILNKKVEQDHRLMDQFLELMHQMNRICEQHEQDEQDDWWKGEEE